MENKIFSQFECLLELARSRCHCTPWDYPVPPPSDSNESGGEEEEDEDGFVCDYLGYYCFSQVMNNVSRKEQLPVPARLRNAGWWGKG